MARFTLGHGTSPCRSSVALKVGCRVSEKLIMFCPANVSASRLSGSFSFLADRQEQPTLGTRDSDEEWRFVIDIGCYAHLRKLDGRLNGIDVSDREAKEKPRSAPAFGESDFESFLLRSPGDVEAALLSDAGA